MVFETNSTVEICPDLFGDCKLPIVLVQITIVNNNIPNKSECLLDQIRAKLCQFAVVNLPVFPASNYSVLVNSGCLTPQVLSGWLV